MRRAAIPVVLLAASMPAWAQEQAVRWNCNAHEQMDEHVSAYMETLLGEPGAVRQHVDFYVSWARQPRYIAEQQMSWVGIPVDATRLWKPDRYSLDLAGDRTDVRGLVIFTSPSARRIDVPALRVVRSLRPEFNITSVTIEDASQRTQIWEGRAWTAEHVDRQGNSLGRGPMLLPGEAAIQPVFARLRAELDRRATDPDHLCRTIPQPTPEELEERQADYGTRMPTPNLDAVEPVPVRPR